MFKSLSEVPASATGYGRVARVLTGVRVLIKL